MKSFDTHLNEKACDLVGMNQIKAFEKFVDNMFKRFNIDFNFTKHFGDRMGDDRNKPCISMKELADFIKKIYKRQGKSIKGVAGAEAVIKDMQSDLNIPVAVKYDQKNDEFDVVMKTIMRKKNFHTPDKVIKYESHIAEAFNTKIPWKQTLDTDHTEKYQGKIGKQFIKMIYNWSQKATHGPKTDVTVVFTVGDTTSKTGKGDQMKIFGAVINHLKEFIIDNPQIRILSFTASKDSDDNETGSRSKLYARLIKRFALKMKFKVEALDLDDIELYILTRK